MRGTSRGKRILSLNIKAVGLISRLFISYGAFCACALWGLVSANVKRSLAILMFHRVVPRLKLAARQFWVSSDTWISYCIISRAGDFSVPYAINKRGSSNHSKKLGLLNVGDRRFTAWGHRISSWPSLTLWTQMMKCQALFHSWVHHLAANKSCFISAIRQNISTAKYSQFNDIWF